MKKKKVYRAVFAVLWAAFVCSGILRYGSAGQFEAIGFGLYAFAMSYVAVQFVKWARLSSLDELPKNCSVVGCTLPIGHDSDHGRV
jgi:hypothetical protein